MSTSKYGPLGVRVFDGMTGEQILEAERRKVAALVKAEEKAALAGAVLVGYTVSPHPSVADRLVLNELIFENAGQFFRIDDLFSNVIALLGGKAKKYGSRKLMPESRALLDQAIDARSVQFGEAKRWQKYPDLIRRETGSGH